MYAQQTVGRKSKAAKSSKNSAGSMPKHEVIQTEVVQDGQEQGGENNQLISTENNATGNAVNAVNVNATGNANGKTPMTAQVSFEENFVKIVFQRGESLHVVQVPFPDI